MLTTIIGKLRFIIQSVAAVDVNIVNKKQTSFMKQFSIKIEYNKCS